MYLLPFSKKSGKNTLPS